MTGDDLAALYTLAHDPDADWMDWGICSETNPDLFFAEENDSVSSRRAKVICRGCPVISECLAYALDRGELGVWGGTTERERRRRRAAQRAAA